MILFLGTYFLVHFIGYTGLAPGPSIGIAAVGVALSAGQGDLFGWVGLGGG